MAEAGTHAVIVGESLIKQEDIEQAVRRLVKGN
jgi:indole-3-glycerol phosphate synthase